MVLGVIVHEGNGHRKERRQGGREREKEKGEQREKGKEKIKGKEGKRDGGRILPNRIHQNRKVSKTLSLPNKMIIISFKNKILLEQPIIYSYKCMLQT